jgi:hypothetical protein
MIAAAVASLVALAGPRVASAAAPPTGYLAAPTEQLAVPGSRASAEITPEGDIYTGWAEYELSVGSHLRPWTQPTRILPDPSIPLFESQLVREGISYTQQAFSVSVSGRPVVYLSLTARNMGARVRLAVGAMQVEYSRGPTVVGTHHLPTSAYRFERPPTVADEADFFQLGEPFSPTWQYRIQGRDVDRDGLLLLRGPVDAMGLGTPSSASPDAAHARQEYVHELAPGQSVSWVWQIPLQPPAAGRHADADLARVGVAAARTKLVRFWRSQERGLTQISVPEQRVDSVYAANVAEILQSRYLTPGGWEQAVNRLQYQAYWIRDSSAETVALDQVGLHAPATEDLAYLAHWQRTDGEYISRAGQQDGVGEALWELSEHARLTGSPRFAQQQLPNVSRAVDWITRVSAGDGLGLLPPSSVGDDEFLVNSHITGDNVWAAVGLRSAIALARLAGRADLATAWTAEDTRFEGALDRAVANDVAANQHITPGLDASGGYDWGNFWASYPLPILSPRSAAVRDTVRWFEAHSREGLATYADGISLHDYLGFPIFETELEAGQVAAALGGFYAELAHTTAPGYGWEDGMGAFGSRRSPVNLAPHGMFAAQFVSLLRNLLVEDSAGGIDLLRGVSPAWMKPGDRIVVAHAPTLHGTISFTVTVAASGRSAMLRWRRAGGKALSLRWILPYWVKRARTPTGRVVYGALPLRGRSGAIALAWGATTPPHLSAAQATAALDRSYVARRQRPPIVPSAGW